MLSRYLHCNWIIVVSPGLLLSGFAMFLVLPFRDKTFLPSEHKSLFKKWIKVRNTVKGNPN